MPEGTCVKLGDKSVVFVNGGSVAAIESRGDGTVVHLTSGGAVVVDQPFSSVAAAIGWNVAA